MKVRPIQFTPASEEQRREIEVYAQVKGFRNAAALALFATINYMTRNGYTAAQKAKVDELLGKP
jgi:hypothetical protein